MVAPQATLTVIVSIYGSGTNIWIVGSIAAEFFNTFQPGSVLKTYERDLKTQQTPKEEAQVPLAVPPAASHSLALKHCQLWKMCENMLKILLKAANKQTISRSHFTLTNTGE